MLELTGVVGHLGRAEVFFSETESRAPRISAITLGGMPALPAVCPPVPSPTAAGPPAAPPPPAGDPPAPGGVIVRSAPTGADPFAPIEVRCRDEERLVGGGCGGGCALVENSEPIAYGRTDSVAAGWRCKCSRAVSGGAPPVGFALCQALRAAQ